MKTFQENCLENRKFALLPIKNSRLRQNCKWIYGGNLHNRFCSHGGLDLDHAQDSCNYVDYYSFGDPGSVGLWLIGQTLEQTVEAVSGVAML